MTGENMLTTQQATAIALALLGPRPNLTGCNPGTDTAQFRIDGLTTTAGPVLLGLLLDFHFSPGSSAGDQSGPTAYQLYIGYYTSGSRCKLVSVSLSALKGKTWVRHPVGNMGHRLDGLQEWGCSDELGEDCCV